MSANRRVASKKQAVQAAVQLTDRQVRRRVYLFFALFIFVIYGRSISDRYALDDELVTYKNEQIHKGIKAIPEIFTSNYVLGEGESSYEYRPLVKVTYAIEYQFFGENPHVSHFINLVFYFFCLVLLFRLLCKLFPDHNLLFPLLICTLFLVHPLHSEVVISLKNRDVMMTFICVMISMNYYIRFAEGGSIWNLAGGVIFYFLSLICKRDSMTILAFLPFTLWFFRKSNLRKIGIVMLSFLPVILMFRLTAGSVGNTGQRAVLEWENPLFNGSTFLERIPQGFYSLYFYIKSFFIPFPLISYYGFRQVPVVGWSHPAVWLTIAALLVAMYYIWKRFKLREPWVFGLIFFLITISMFANVVVPVVGIVAERFTFLPSVGLCIAVAWAFLKLMKVDMTAAGPSLRRVKKSVILIPCVIFLIYSLQVVARCPEWMDHYTLYRTDVAKAPESAHLHTLLAATSIQKVKSTPNISRKEKNELVKDAVDHYKESLRLLPEYISSHNNLGMVYYSFYQKPELAMPHLKKAISLDKNYEEAYFNLATCEVAVSQYDSAEAHFLKCIALKPGFLPAYISLSKLYVEQRKYAEVVRLNEEAIRRGMTGDAPYINIGNSFFVRGDTASAIPYLEKAISVVPDNYNLNNFLAGYYYRHADSVKANYYNDLKLRSRIQR